MPSLDDWIGKPLEITRNVFERNQDLKGYVLEVQQYFQNKLSTTENRTLVPSINDVPLHNLRTNSLVRFRCMVQDMYDPEYYLGMYEVKDVKLNKKTMHCGMWKDIADCGSQEEVMVNSPNNKTMDRQTLYCVPIPGENDWAKKIYSARGQGQTNETPSTSTNTRQKRCHDDEDGGEMDNGVVKQKNEMNNVNGLCDSESISMETDEEKSHEVSTTKKTKIDESGEAPKPVSLPALDLNFPLKGEKGPACLIKLYDAVDVFKVNDMVEFIGILSNDPAMVGFSDDKRNAEQTALLNPAEIIMDSMEEQVHHPPPSLVPRLHVLVANNLAHCNPLLPEKIDDESVTSNEEIIKLLKEAAETRQQILSLLQDALYGDILAAEYLLCHLISNVYTRHDVTAMGKFSLNIKGCPKNVPFPENFYKLLKTLLSKSHLIPLTVPTLNSSKFTPFKDYSANRLITGQLQLSNNTEILVDETVMQPGQLDTNGVRSLTALGNIITWQKVEYDFNYHKQDFPSNLPVLVMSEGKSLLACDSHITLSPQNTVTNIEEHFQKILENLNPEKLEAFRSYLGIVQLVPYSLPENVQKDVENDFVEIRKENRNNMTVEDFQILLVLARLVSVSHGKMTLDKMSWEKAKQLEHDRKQRMQIAPQTA